MLNAVYDPSERSEWEKWVGCDTFSKMSSRASADFLPAFKRRKRYQNLPTTRLLLQSLIRKWNSCIPDRPMPETEDEALEELAADLVCRSFQLQDSTFFLKGNAIPGFTGSILFENRLTGAQGLRVDALLHFAPFSGVGIKTALGMGGVARIPH